MFTGTIGRARFLLSGLALMAVKAVLDRFLFAALLGLPYGWRAYWSPIAPLELTRDPGRAWAWFALLAAGLIFIWIGVALTVRRSRDCGAPVWAAFLFFVPVLNLLYFTLLCLLPGGGAARSERKDARPASGSVGGPGVFMAGAAAAAVGTLLSAFGAAFIRDYGWGLFVCTPFVMGLISALLLNRRGTRSWGADLGAALIGLALAGVLLLAVSVEGAICLVMASPLAAALALLGIFVGRQVSLRRAPRGALTAMGALIAGLPLLMSFERKAAPAPPVYAVSSAVEIDAPPEVVWRQVVAFPEIAPPREFLFTHGIAYPIRAEIAGSGPGAIRRCVFNSGAFVEPIEVWDENRQLKFSVTENPPPMTEWSPYRIDPPHLHGFLVSNGGQFLLEPAPGGGTRLTGTTWYRHSLWPAGYWKLWSDAIIHRIHLRVLEHIKREAERAMPPHRPANSRASAS